MTEHERMLTLLWRNPHILQNALKLNSIFIRGTEYPVCPVSDDRVDLVFQDKMNLACPEKDTTLYVLELKSHEEADHIVLGQIKKAVEVLKTVGKQTKHWNNVEGVAIAKGYTRSGLRLILEEGYRAFLWNEAQEGVKLHELTGRRCRRKICK